MNRERRVVELHIEGIANGGHCIAHLDGRVVFVRHTAPGERVLAALTDDLPKATYWRAEAVDVITAHPGRVASAWPAAGVGGVGGAEFSHLSLATQRELKATVLTEQLAHLGKVQADVAVQAVPGDEERNGLGYRTRIELATTPRGRLGMRAHRSRKVIQLESMPLATAEIESLGLFDRRWPPRSEVRVVAPAGSDAPLVLTNGDPWRSSGADRRPSARRTVRESTHVTVGGVRRTYQFKVAGAGFWQVHDAAPSLLAQRVIDLVSEGLSAGGSVADLYSGAGLFTAPLADVVGASGSVWAVESDTTAVRDARRGDAHRDQVMFCTGPVDEVLASEQVPARLDAVVLDPPRSGAGRVAVEQIAARQPELVVYVSCDPASFARDVAYFAEQGYDLHAVEAWDVFPHTHHVETIGTFTRT